MTGDTGDIVNLKRARKAKQRQESEVLAQQNRLSFGRSKGEKLTSQASQTALDRKLDLHKRQFGKDEAS